MIRSEGWHFGYCASDDGGVQRILRRDPSTNRRFLLTRIKTGRIANHSEVFLGVLKVLIYQDLGVDNGSRDVGVPRNRLLEVPIQAQHFLNLLLNG